MTDDELATFFAQRDAAWVNHDAETLVARYADDCVVESPHAGTLRGREAVRNIYRHWFAAFPDVVLESHELLREGNRVAQVASLCGTDTGGFLGQPATGRPFRIDVVLLIEFVDELIAHERRVYDLHGVLMQLASEQTSERTPSEAYQTTLERARMAQELRMAAEIQRLLLPQGHHRGNSFDVAATSVPCRAIGGDFFDYFELPHGAFGFALGDVAGKGPPAALLAAELQGMLASYTRNGGGAAETLQHVNEVLVRRKIASRFATLVYGVLLPDGRLTYCNAGHNPPFLVSAQAVCRLSTGGLILGAFDDISLGEETVQLSADDVLVVFSDGLTEALNLEGAEFGEERLLSCVTANRDLAASAILDGIVTSVREFRGGAEQNDDLTTLVLRVF